MSSDPLTAALAPALRALAGVDLSDPSAAESALAARLSAADGAALTAALLDAHATRGLTPKRATESLTFGRLAKASDDTLGFSIDAVDMSGAGAAHTHPKGEVSWCIALDGTPTFEGCAAGWKVMPPGSRHVPTVVGGRMLIVYFLPDGAMDWST